MVDENDVIGNEVFPLPVLIYGRSACQDTARVRQHLDRLDIPFVEFNIDQDEDAADYVHSLVNGREKTPVVVFGDQEWSLVQPDQAELDRSLQRAGYRLEK